VGSKFGVRFQRMQGFIIGLQASFRTGGGVRLSLCGWSLWIGMVPVREVTKGDVVNGDPLDKILAENGKSGSFSIEYKLSK